MVLGGQYGTLIGSERIDIGGQSTQNLKRGL